MIHFDLEQRYQDDNVVGSAISRRDGVALAVVAHVLMLALLVFGPKLAVFQPSPEEIQQQEELARQQEEQRNQMMVFVQPKVDTPAPQPPPVNELSDLDRKAQAPEISKTPDNPLPFARGNSAERNEATPEERAKGPETPAPPQPQPESTEARILPPSNEGLMIPRNNRPQTPASGSLGEALKNLQKYVQNQTFDNPQGNQRDPGATIQFDTKGVEFGPWLRRFVATVRRHWDIPQAAYTMHGHVVLQFSLWKDGHITDLVVLEPSAIGGFTTAAANAITSLNFDLVPLPPEYPAEKATFTVTFYYNERPPS